MGPVGNGQRGVARVVVTAEQCLGGLGRLANRGRGLPEVVPQGGGVGGGVPADTAIVPVAPEGAQGLEVLLGGLVVALGPPGGKRKLVQPPAERAVGKGLGPVVGPGQEGAHKAVLLQVPVGVGLSQQRPGLAARVIDGIEERGGVLEQVKGPRGAVRRRDGPRVGPAAPERHLGPNARAEVVHRREGREPVEGPLGRVPVQDVHLGPQGVQQEWARTVRGRVQLPSVRSPAQTRRARVFAALPRIPNCRAS